MLPTRLKSIIEDARRHRRIYILAVCANFVAIFYGWDTGLIGGVLGMESFQLSFGLQSLSSAELATVQGNIVSTLQGGAFFGAALSAYLSDRIGRYPTLYIATTIFLIGSIIQTCAGITSTSLAEIYVGRFIGGFGVGLSSAVVPVYISESSPAEVRGRTTGTMELLNVSGIMLSYWANYGLAQNIRPVTDPEMWRIAFGLQMAPGILFLITMVNQSESPRWLIEHGRVEEARAVMARLRQVPVNDPELDITVQEIVDDVQGKENLPMWKLLRLCCASWKTFYKCIIGCILMFFQQWTGTNGLNFYAPEIFESLGLSGTNAGLFATGVYGIIKTVSTLAGLLLLVEQLGRKRCMIYGGLLQSGAMFFLGAYLKIYPTGPPIPTSYAAIVSVYMYVFGFGFGWGTIPYIVAAEIVPNHLRTVSMSAATMTQWLFVFIIAQITPTMLDTIKYGAFLLFGSLCAIAVIFAYALVPETKGIPLEEIQLIFQGNVVQRSIADAPGGKVVCRAMGWQIERELGMIEARDRLESASSDATIKM